MQIAIIRIISILIRRGIDLAVIACDVFGSQSDPTGWGTSPPDPLGYLKREEEQRFIHEVLPV